MAPTNARILAFYLPSLFLLSSAEVIPLSVQRRRISVVMEVSTDRDHQYCNPTTDSNPGLAALEKVGSLGWRVLVTGGSGDPLIDRQVKLAKVMEEKGASVVGQFFYGHHHGARFESLAHVIKDFVYVTTMKG
ncbi:hypothetical protein MLD38_029089 [Melastoma candidum]|uniref:Uncharacterized protein n=1 Tax=Melastoma candidum TaxID=119954 RepID=A0ACB9N5C8_9MYRT|nr:hypothetical protein MLD38_029089 [Melastoma candidum]